MALKHAEPCQVVNLDKFAEQARDGSSNALVKHDVFEAIIMHLSPGDSVPSHAVDGPITVQCLRGAVDFPVNGESRPMRAGDWMYLPGGTPHGLKAREDATLLVTILFTPAE